jgi:tetratricopeptide (TPR) repeat protein
VTLKRKKEVRAILLAIAVLLAGALTAHTAGTVSAEPEALLPSDIKKLYNSGQYREAAEALQSAASQNPKNAGLYYYCLGRCYFEVRDFTRSISSWEHAIALDPSRSEYHDWLGRGCGRKAEENSHSNMASALSLARRTHHEFEVAVQLDSANISARRDLIAFMVSAPASLGGGEEHALEQIHSLSAVDPVEGELALADLYAEHKKFEQASEEYQKVLKSAPARIDADLEVADYYRDRNDSEDMQQAVDAAAKIAPSDRRLNYYHGVMLVLEKKEPDLAEKDLRAYIDTVPDNSEVPAHSSAYEWLGKLYEDEKKPDLAAEQYQTALTLDPQNKALREALKRLQKK